MGDGDYESPEMLEILWQLFARTILRSWPYDVEASIKECKKLVEPMIKDLGPANRYLYGPEEFVFNGQVLDWDATDRLAEITVPTLMLL